MDEYIKQNRRMILAPNERVYAILVINLVGLTLRIFSTPLSFNALSNFWMNFCRQD